MSADSIGLNAHPKVSLSDPQTPPDAWSDRMPQDTDANRVLSSPS